MEWVLGTAQLGGLYGATQTAEVESPGELLSRAWECGFTAVDTARSYPGVEEIIGKCGWPGRIDTKLTKGWTVAESLSQSLEALSKDRLGILYFHDPDVVEQETEFIAETKKQLVPKYAADIGVSVYTLEQFLQGANVEAVDVVQVPINMLDRRISDDVLISASHQVKIFARSVFLQGILLLDGQYLPRFFAGLAPSVAAIRQLSNDSGLSPTDLAIGWVLSRPGLAGLVVGVESVRQLEAVHQALQRGPLDKWVLRRIEEIPVNDERLLDPRIWRV